jgi:hypothetical protein
MRAPKNHAVVANLAAQLDVFSKLIPLDGINALPQKNCFLYQLEDSIRRVQYVQTIGSIQHDQSSANPNLAFFNPITAAAWYLSNGNVDEASWLVFLITHFGKNKRTGWRLLKDVYSGLGQQLWDWGTVSVAPDVFGHWIDVNRSALKANGIFGNHRKYESLKYRITGGAVRSYVDWVGPNLSHMVKFAQMEPANASPKSRFAIFYKSCSRIYRFGRMGTFDYLTMMGKLNILDVEPDSVYFAGATGPIPGAKMLFTGNPNANLTNSQLENQLSQLEAHLGLPFGMQILEDALCNWQKSPIHYIHFKG